MKNLEKVVTRIEADLDEKDKVREIALKSSRAIVRAAGSILRGLHKGKDGKTEYSELRKEVSKLWGVLAEHPEFANAGYVENAFQEYAEAGIVQSILDDGDVPSPQDLGVGNVPYLLGLGDSVGELRRFCLDELKSGKVVRANELLEMMEDIYSAMMRFDYPDAIVPLRHKQDVARSLLEKTRGEVAVATSTRNLHEKIEEVLRKG